MVLSLTEIRMIIWGHCLPVEKRGVVEQRGFGQIKLEMPIRYPSREEERQRMYTSGVHRVALY